ncbi:hypothetical protein [Cesiribacter andamanensis]|uniref:Uncharacterized protein n=1 Tax=Cesiribacter andamanensis AMV16 TaxID=1279009 RepID=M7NGY3_9BACT|nr:hypothetical protein [Cesiribacter andamanensis]EMR01100.1 hypothetical protein ADICEAN_03771 [Cesiribacter andamanensis AMV16]
MKLLHKQRHAVDGQAVDFIFLEDADFRTLIQGSPHRFVSDYQEADIAVVLVGYPSLTSVAPEGINFSVGLLGELYASETPVSPLPGQA